MQNGVMMQYFHWYYPADGSLWKKLKQEAPSIAEIGISAVWLPPAFKGSTGALSVGYDVYDIYDLGEFDQKNSSRTKYGTKQQYLEAIEAAHKAGLQVYADIVVNHMSGADEKEKITVRKVDPENRNEFISDPYEIEGYTKFTFPGRHEKYSSFAWNSTCFTGIDFDAGNNESGIFKILNDNGGEQWEDMIDDEKGNYDYLMYDDIEFRNGAVREELKKWGKWYYDIAKFDGVRLDAVKHINPGFYNEWLDYMRKETGIDFFAVGEYWAPGNLPLLEKYIAFTEQRMSVFDSSLQHNFHIASEQKNSYDLSAILNDTLVRSMPALAVTVVDNHDTQPLQSLEAPVADWFKPLAYALILLRQEGYPSVFYPDLYGAEYTDRGQDGNEYNIVLSPVRSLEGLLWLRRNKLADVQQDYFDHPNCIGWTSTRDDGQNGAAVIMSNGEEGFKKMEMGKQYAGKLFIDHLGNHDQQVTIDGDGYGTFLCRAESVSVWIAQ